MKFKLKQSNVKPSGEKASPFKINESLVMGAGIAAGGFASNLAGGYNQGAYPQAAPSADPGRGGDSSVAEEKSKQKSCTEMGLTGDALVDCQKRINDKYGEDMTEHEDQKAKDEAAKLKNEQEEEENTSLFKSFFKKDKEKT